MFIHQLQWNEFFTNLQKFGNQFIDKNRADQLVEKTGDYHTIIHRQVNDFPHWIIKGFPLPILVFQVFAISPRSIGMIHKDGIDRKAALNIPLDGCDKGTMDWFVDGFTERLIKTQYTNVRLTDEERNFNAHRSQSAPSFSCPITQPSIVNTDIWHRINNFENTNYRYMLSFRFNENPSFTDLKKITIDYFSR